MVTEQEIEWAERKEQEGRTPFFGRHIPFNGTFPKPPEGTPEFPARDEHGMLMDSDDEEDDETGEQHGESAEQYGEGEPEDGEGNEDDDPPVDQPEDDTEGAEGHEFAAEFAAHPTADQEGMPGTSKDFMPSSSSTPFGQKMAKTLRSTASKWFRTGKQSKPGKRPAGTDPADAGPAKMPRKEDQKQGQGTTAKTGKARPARTGSILEKWEPEPKAAGNKIHPGKPSPCFVCDPPVILPSGARLKVHMETEHRDREDRKVRCWVQGCPRMSSNPKDLWAHVGRDHQDLIRCSQCLMMFTTVQVQEMQEHEEQCRGAAEIE